VSWRAALWSWRSRMSERLPCRSSVPCPRRFRFRHGVPGGVDGVRPDTTGQAVSESLSDRGVVPVRCPRGRVRRPPWTGLRTFRHRAWVQVSRWTGPDAGSGWGWPKGACALPSCPVRARTCRPRGWPWPADRTHGRTLGAGGVRRLAARRPDRVPTHRLGGHIELGMSGRPDAGEVRHVRHPASHCRVSAGGTDRRRRCPGECPAAAPWRKRAPRRTAGMSGTPW
jgi:hypothetical protein